MFAVSKKQFSVSVQC